MSTLSPPEHQHSEAVVLAAQWLAEEQNPVQPVITTMRARFGLTAVEACEAAALANRFRTYRRANG